MEAAKNGAKKEGLEVGVKTTSKTISKTLKNKISKLIKDDFSEVVYKVYKYAKKHPKKFSLATAVLPIGPLWYSWDKLADIYGITDKDKSTNTQSSATEEKVVTITDYDKTWDYKKDGDKYYTKKKDSDKWTLTSGTSKEAIKTMIFGSGSKYGKTILTPEQKEIESFVKNNPEYIVENIDVSESILNDMFYTSLIVSGVVLNIYYCLGVYGSVNSFCETFYCESISLRLTSLFIDTFTHSTSIRIVVLPKQETFAADLFAINIPIRIGFCFTNVYCLHC